MKKIMLNAFLLCILLLSATTNAQTISQLSFYSPLINTFDMKYINNHLVVSQNGLLIFDVTNPAQKPKLIGQTTYPGSIAYRMAVQGNLVYMGFGSNGILAVYDISSFNTPTLKGSLAIPSLSFYGVGDIQLHGNYAYLSGFDSLYIVDISNSTSPKLANVIPVTHTQFTGAEDLAIDGNSLFVKTSASIDVYNVTNAVAPTYASSINYLHVYNNRLVADTINHRLFLSWATALKDFTGYDAYDVSNVTSSRHLFSDSTEFSPGDFGILDYSYFDNILFASRGGSINAFDVSANHHFVTSFSGQDIPNSSVSIQVKDSVFFHARGGGIEVLKYGEEAEPVCSAPENLKQQINGTTAYLRWSKMDNSKGYIVSFRAIGTSEWKVSASIDNTQTLKNLTPGTAYTWQVKTVCSLRPLSTSNQSLYNIFYVKKKQEKVAITLAPNPVKDILHVHINDMTVARILISDIIGGPLFSLKISGKDINIPVSQLHTGNYVVQAYDNKNIIIATARLFKE